MRRNRIDEKNEITTQSYIDFTVNHYDCVYKCL
jgi:hypothetical protein